MSSLREVVCLACQRTFYLHLRCDRGDRHCSKACAVRRRKELLLHYQLKYQGSEKGKLKHREAQRAYRIRQREAAADAKGLADLKQAAPRTLVTVVGDRAGHPDHAGGVDQRDEHEHTAGSVSAAAGNAEAGHQASADLNSPDAAVAASDRLEPALEERDTDQPGMQESAPISDGAHNPVEVIDQGALTPTESALIVAARPWGLAASNKSPDATVVAGDRTGPAVDAGCSDERYGQDPVTGTLATWAEVSGSAQELDRSTGTVVRWLGPCCARCGRPGRILRHPPLDKSL